MERAYVVISTSRCFHIFIRFVRGDVIRASNFACALSRSPTMHSIQLVNSYYLYSWIAVFESYILHLCRHFCSHRLCFLKYELLSPSLYHFLQDIKTYVQYLNYLFKVHVVLSTFLLQLTVFSLHLEPTLSHNPWNLCKGLWRVSAEPTASESQPPTASIHLGGLVILQCMSPFWVPLTAYIPIDSRGTPIISTL